MNGGRYRPKESWGDYQESLSEWTDRAARQSLIPRIWAKDASLWTGDPEGQREVRARLGWLTAPGQSRELAGDIQSVVSEVRKAGFSHVVLLGMGGSSLAPAVFQSIFGRAEGYPELIVLDSTDPLQVKDTEQRAEIEKTLFIVSSKSGGTIELLSFFKYFYDKVRSRKGDEAGSHFIAITDPGTPLETLAKTHRFRKVFLAPADVGGRFSALTYFGLLPAGLIGVDLDKVLEAAGDMAGAVSPSVAVRENAALSLGIGMAVLAEEGRDKLTLLTSPSLESFADWAEQLVAESSGKEGAGIVPVVREPIGPVESYGHDRFFVALLSDGEKTAEDTALEKKLAELAEAGHPVLRYRLREKWDLGAEFFRWEMATAVACALLKINAFDQPDVQSAKERTKALLGASAAGREIPVKISERDLGTFWENAEEGDYAAILAFLPDRPALRKALTDLQREIRDRRKMAVTVGLGPRYLHSTGQLHKGGPNKGVFLLVTTEHAEDLPVPGEPYGFARLELAQAMGEMEALEEKGRWVFHYRLKEASGQELDRLAGDVRVALG
ncbi:MAG: glucose-6-phosphate isomerase [Candidatus Omnitrophica bacterium]|nr:glucose-6-phosphate isomerase [Candidatus Omnitrophota bacterium]